MRGSRTGPAHFGPSGFTLFELLVVLAVLSLAALFLAPALARTRSDSRAFQCLNNSRQMALAFQLYHADNQDFFPPNPADANQVPGHNWCAGQAGAGGAQEFNPDLLKNPTVTLVAPYLRTNPDIFHCPADARTGRYTGTEPGKIGTTVKSARSISMNLAVGTICAGFDANGGSHNGPPKLPTNGLWLDNNYSHRRDSPYKTFGKATSFSIITPARIWLTMDEDGDSMNESSFAFGMKTAEWIDFPATYHEMGAGLSFGDGHAEIHHWLDARTRVINHNPMHRTPVPGSVDWQWLAARTSITTR
jgi:prepilin-type N-terminal cleavage/methylation domain-containing protein